MNPFENGKSLMLILVSMNWFFFIRSVPWWFNTLLLFQRNSHATSLFGFELLVWLPCAPALLVRLRLRYQLTNSAKQHKLGQLELVFYQLFEIDHRGQITS